MARFRGSDDALIAPPAPMFELWVSNTMLVLAFLRLRTHSAQDRTLIAMRVDYPWYNVVRIMPNIMSYLHAKQHKRLRTLHLARRKTVIDISHRARVDASSVAAAWTDISRSYWSFILVLTYWFIEMRYRKVSQRHD